MTETEVAVKLEGHEKEIGSLKHRVTTMEQLQGEIRSLAISTNRLAGSVESLVSEQNRQQDEIDKHDGRISGLELRPVKRHEQVVGYVISAGISCLVTGLISAVLALVIK